MWNLKRKNIYKEQIDGCQMLGEMGTVVKKVQTSSYKINKFWGCKVHHGDHN